MAHPCLSPPYARQLLWVNLVTDGLPATAIGFNKPDPLIMKQRPRRADKGIVDRWLFTRCAIVRGGRGKLGLRFECPVRTVNLACNEQPALLRRFGRGPAFTHQCHLMPPVPPPTLLPSYILVGAYVGAATVAGFIWWFLSFEVRLTRLGVADKALSHQSASTQLLSSPPFPRPQDGPQLTWQALRSFQKCEGDACGVFRSKSPSTVSMSVLVVVEMFNALNALSGGLVGREGWMSCAFCVCVDGASLSHACVSTHPLAVD